MNKETEIESVDGKEREDGKEGEGAAEGGVGRVGEVIAVNALYSRQSYSLLFSSTLFSSFLCCYSLLLLH